MSRDNEGRSPPLDDEPTISTEGSPGAGPENRSSDPSSDDAEFGAGQVIAGRFRIVGRLGSGGMGDVYRADDHELGTSVALKFLPAGLAGDPVRLSQLRNEVRLARQIAHPNVCGVYDIGDSGGRPFLSMEFIDGEDLASLLRRIGRLPKDKAIELAREICAGVGAAHELGVIHRDLKPANVMIDGRGRARVADFGLAGTIDELGGGRDAMAGTPAYMAPEQFHGAVASRQTDIFSLGLLLYELFTGKRAHDKATIAELRERYSSSAPPTSPSDLVEGMDPAVERVIMHCLESDPDDRPTSALAVMAALPGGDPLAALLKAGEMPSPELVAASGRRGTLKPTRAFQLGAVISLGVALTILAYGRPPLGEIVGGILPPEVLVHRAEVVLIDLGYRIEKADSAWDFDLDWRIASRLPSVSATEQRALLLSEVNPVLRFWYRTSSSPMAPWHGSLPGLNIGNVVTPEDPPLNEAGMAFVRLSPRGALLELRVMPGSPRQMPNPVEAEIIDSITRVAGLDPSHIERVEWAGVSPMPGETSISWRAGDPGRESSSREIVATFDSGLPTWVQVDPPPTTAANDLSEPGQDRLSLVFFLFFVGGGVVAVLNIRAGRWDRRGAARLAIVAFILCFLSELIGSHHPLSVSEEVRGFFKSIAYAATRGLMTWLLYIAIEPFIRRLHPRSLVSWSRLLAGRVLDPAVGRDVLVGLAVIAGLGPVTLFLFWAFDLGGSSFSTIAFITGKAPLSTSSFLSSIIRYPVVALGSALGFLLIYVVARWLLGRFNRIAPLVLWVGIFLFFSGAYNTSGQAFLATLLYSSVAATATTYLAVRHGLLAFVTCTYFAQVFLTTIMTLDPGDWYFAPTAIVVLLIATLTIFGVKTSMDRNLLPTRP